ncbi:MAG: FtsQ-type POTRA domain-containing protein [Deltaproteobacteria bacterium]|nr:FtsQ-type POTRA domain-containing protein [Deltaproteobacteria bacterium]
MFPRLWGRICLIVSVFFKFSFLVGSIVGISMVFLSIHQYLITSPHIRLEHIIVSGIDDEDLKQELIDMGQLGSDICLLTINLRKMKVKMEKHPWVRSIKAEKQYPHTLVIQAVKEEPRALVVSDRLFYMNRFGDLFKEVGTSDDMDYPVVTTASQNGSSRQEQLKLAAHAMDLLEAETGLLSHDQLSEIHVDNDGCISLYSLNMPTVIRVNGDEFDDKKTELKKIMAHLERTGRIYSVKTIDLNYDDRAVVSFKNG